MAKGESAFDRSLTAATIQTTETGTTGVVLANVEVSDEGESDTRAPMFGALGISSRPLDPDDDGAAEAICARASDSLPVIASRDMRLEAGAAAPEKGTIRLLGYHGATVSIEVAGASSSLVFVRGSDLRVPETDVVQGDPNQAQDLLLAQPAIDLHAIMGQIVLLLAAAVNGLAPGTIAPQQIADLTAALAPFLVGGSPEAPTTRAPGMRGAPGA